MMEPTIKGPWRVVEGKEVRGQPGVPGYIDIRGPNGEAVCTIFPHAGKGGIGADEARRIARHIAASAPR